MMNNTQKKYMLGVHVALVALMILVIILSYQNSELKKARQPLERAVISEGEQIDLSGLMIESGQFEPIGERTLLCIFSTSCPFCERNFIYWNQLWDLNSATTSIIAVSLSEQAKLGDFLKRVPVSLPIALPSDMEEFKRQNKLSFVPLTLLVDQNAVVKKSWRGLLDSISVKAIRDSLGDALQPN